MHCDKMLADELPVKCCPQCGGIEGSVRYLGEYFHPKCLNEFAEAVGEGDRKAA